MKSAIAGSTGSNVSIEMSALEPMMKRGKAAFAWKTLRATAQPAIDASVGAAQDEIEVDIPLKLIIPHFMAASKPATEQKQVDVDNSIPDVFSKEDIAARTAPAPEPAATAPTPAPAPAPATAPAPAPAPAPTTSPADLVAKICQLPGVTGALITMGDGLAVAKQLPDGVDGDALAGFVPELFNKAARYSNASKLGAAAVADIHTEAHTLSVRKAGEAYVAVLGAAGAALPSRDLEQLAAASAGNHS